MKKLILLTLMGLLIVASAYGMDMCKDSIEINTNCTMITPHLQCSAYTYDIINVTNQTNAVILDDANLSNVNGSIYYFNFTQPEGDYMVRLCDNSTREVRVTQEDTGKMIIAALIILPLLFGFVLLIGSATLGEDHVPLRIFLFLLSLVTFWVSLHYGIISLVKFYNFTELQDLIGTTTFWSGIVFFVIVSYFIIYTFYKIVGTAAQNKKERLNY